MAELRLYKREVNTVFDLLGSKEDDITYSLGWALANSDSFVRAFLGELSNHDPGEIVRIDLQQSIRDGGRTDIEIITTEFHVIIEAKRGWWFPDDEQLGMYAPRFEESELDPILVVAAEASSEYAASQGFTKSKRVGELPVSYLPWSRFAAVADQVRTASRNHAEKRLMQEIHAYLKGLMSSQNIFSNMVYVVSLGYEDEFGTGETFVSIVEDHDMYFHPFGRGGWPKVPPNYLGFRYDGKLQCIRHVDAYGVSDDPWNAIPKLKNKTSWPKEPHLSYSLGTRISPPKDVRSTNIRNTRLWAPLDLLLTCDTIPEAVKKGKQREAFLSGS